MLFKRDLRSSYPAYLDGTLPNINLRYKKFRAASFLLRQNKILLRVAQRDKSFISSVQQLEFILANTFYLTETGFICLIKLSAL